MGMQLTELTEWTPRIENKVINCIGEQCRSNSPDIELTHSLVDDLDLDSLDLLELLICLEDDFGIEIQDSDMEKCITVQDVINYMKTRIKQ